MPFSRGVLAGSLCASYFVLTVPMCPQQVSAIAASNSCGPTSHHVTTMTDKLLSQLFSAEHNTCGNKSLSTSLWVDLSSLLTSSAFLFASPKYLEQGCVRETRLIRPPAFH